jgi:hypothetical protein
MLTSQVLVCPAGPFTAHLNTKPSNAKRLAGMAVIVNGMYISHFTDRQNGSGGLAKVSGGAVDLTAKASQLDRC